MKSLLLVIDLQKSFINEHTKDIPKLIKELVDKNKYNSYVFTKFINDENSRWYKDLRYEGCITAEDRALVIDTKGHPVFSKKTYTSLTDELREYIKENNIDVIYICGIDTDACVLKTALDLFDNNYNVKVLKNYCSSHAGVKAHQNAIEILKRLIGENNIV